MLGMENMKLSASEVKNITSLLRREGEILQEEKETKLKEKQDKQQTEPLEKDLSTPPPEEILRDSATEELEKKEDKQKQ